MIVFCVLFRVLFFYWHATLSLCRCFDVDRDGFGDSSVLGDIRWGGAFGVEATFIAMDTVTVSYIYTKDILYILDKDPALYSVKQTFARLRRNWLANAESISETWRKVRSFNNFLYLTNDCWHQTFFARLICWF